jgi:Gpi18-like mannosyltransferase
MRTVKIHKEVDKVRNIQAKVFKLIERNLTLLGIILFFLLSIIVRVMFLPIESGDYKDFLIIWYNSLKALGGIFGIKENIGNYNAPYMTLFSLLTYIPLDAKSAIKLLSIVFDYLCVAFSIIIVLKYRQTDKDKTFYALLTGVVIVFLPTVVLNSAAWAQSDAMYTAFIIFSLYFMLNEKYRLSFIMLGVSFAFKLQFAFVLPVYVMIYICKRKFPIYYFLFIPLANLALNIPAILLGKPIQDVISVYVNQAAAGHHYLSWNFPSVYAVFFPVNGLFTDSPGEHITKAGVWFTLVLFAIAAFIVFYRKVKFNNERIIEFALWSIMISTFFLPHMHDRYLYAGDIISVIYASVTRKNIYLPVALNLISLYTYSNYLWGLGPVPMQYVAVLFMVVVLKFTFDIFKPILEPSI